jgi:pilus assembly protein CpaE
VIVLIDARTELLGSVRADLGDDTEIEQIERPSVLGGVLDDPRRDVEAVIVGSGVAFDDAIALTERLATERPEVGVVVLVEDISSSDLRRALKAGVVDVLDAQRSPGELREALQRARSRRSALRPTVGAVPSAPEGGRVVVVFSTKGGCGKSVIASNLAIALATRLEEEVGLVDLDLQAGDLAIMLQLLPAWSMYDAAHQGPRLDGEALRGYLTSHRSGVKLLAAPTDPALADQVSGEEVQHLLGLMRELFRVTVVDSPAFFSDPVLGAIDACNEVILVGSLDVPSIKNLKLALHTLHELNVPRERIRIVLNRADSSVGLRIDEVERSLGTDVDFTVPSGREVPLAVNQGMPIVTSKKRSSIVNALNKLAGAIASELPSTGDEEQAPSRRRRKEAS